MNSGKNNEEKLEDNEEELKYEEENETPKDTIKKLREALETCERERQEYLGGWQRAKADFINARRDEETSRSAFIEFAKEGILNEMLPIVDSFDLAFRNKEEREKVDSVWRSGIEHIYTQFFQILKDNGLQPIYPKGENFEPLRHEPVESVETSNKDEDGKVIEVVQKGYALNGKIVRPARVKVGVFKSETNGS